MPNNIAIVTSCIQPESGSFTYSPTRSIFTAEERWRQTVFTVNSIRNSLRDINIVIIDASKEYKEYQNQISYFPGTKFVPLIELSPEIHSIVNSHPNKSVCEALMLSTFYAHYKKMLKRYDFILKMSGRYFCFDLDDSLFTEQNKDKIFFKRPLEFNWQDSWQYDFVDLRKQEKEGILRQYCSVLYAYSTQHLDTFMDINTSIAHFLSQPKMLHYDMETMYYFLTRQYTQNIIETDWRVSGWLGTTGQFMYY